MKTREELTEIYNSLNESEKFGIQFAMFPVRLSSLNLDESVMLMDIRKSIEKNDVNNH